MYDIEIQKVSFAYPNGREVLHDIDFSISAGECVGLIGANGAGKSTLLKLLVGLAGNYRGKLFAAGMPVVKKNVAEIRKQVGFVFQDSDSQLFLSTVYEDVAFGPRNYGLPEEEVEKRVLHALEKVHIEELKDRQIYRMSGGQKKLASIATILSLEPKMILLDEPTIALDPKNRRNLIQVLREMKGTKLIASHDLDMILDTCARTILLSDGRVVKDGPAEEILSNRTLLEENGLELPLILQNREERLISMYEM